MTRKESQQYADDRGERLTKRLAVPADSAIFKTAKVRDAFEHFDERLDSVMVGGMTNLSDWYITDGGALVEPPQSSGSTGAVGLRWFYPAAGILYFRDILVDLFALDIDLINLRIQVKDERKKSLAALAGLRGMYGNHVLASIRQRCLIPR